MSKNASMRWHLRNILNVLGFVSGGHEPQSMGKGPYVGLKESKERQDRERRYYDSPLYRN